MHVQIRLIIYRKDFHKTVSDLSNSLTKTIYFIVIFCEYFFQIIMCVIISNSETFPGFESSCYKPVDVICLKFVP